MVSSFDTIDHVATVQADRPGTMSREKLVAVVGYLGRPAITLVAATDCVLHV